MKKKVRLNFLFFTLPSFSISGFVVISRKYLLSAFIVFAVTSEFKCTTIKNFYKEIRFKIHESNLIVVKYHLNYAVAFNLPRRPT